MSSMGKGQINGRSTRSFGLPASQVSIGHTVHPFTGPFTGRCLLWSGHFHHSTGKWQHCRKKSKGQLILWKWIYWIWYSWQCSFSASICANVCDRQPGCFYSNDISQIGERRWMRKQFLIDKHSQGNRPMSEEGFNGLCDFLMSLIVVHLVKCNVYYFQRTLPQQLINGSPQSVLFSDQILINHNHLY